VEVGRAPMWRLSSEVRQWMNSSRAAVHRKKVRLCLRAEAENGRGREWGPGSTCGRGGGGWQPARRAAGGGGRAHAGGFGGGKIGEGEKPLIGGAWFLCWRFKSNQTDPTQFKRI
jgi:hypothetical protein